MQNQNRVLARMVAEELSAEQLTEVTGGTGRPAPGTVTYGTQGVIDDGGYTVDEN